MQRMVALVLAVTLMAAACGSTTRAGDQSTAGAPPKAAVSPASALPVLTFQTAANGSVPLAVEVADEPFLEQCGLMHRTELPENQGMIFIFPIDGQGGFWMRNTLIPLSIAYVAADGTIVTILEMQPVPGPGYTPFVTAEGERIAVPDSLQPPAGAQTLTYTPRAPYRFAIEANATWFARHGIAEGDHVDVTEAAARGSAGQDPPLCRERGL